MIGLARSLRGFRYDPARGRFRSYLGRVVGHAITRFQQTRRHEVSLEDFSQAAAPAAPEDDQWIDEWRAHHLRLALDAVRPTVEPTSLAVFERLLDGRDVAGVALEAGLTEAAVHKIKQRMRDRLKALVARQIQDEEEKPPTSPPESG
jgi:RNA polymerase sigma factor (sigma-70 family)